MADPDYGDITDPNEGRDITVEVVSAEDSGTSYPVTTIRVKPKETPLATSKEETDKYLNSQKEITELYSELTYAELKNVLEGWLNPSATSDEEKSVSAETLSSHYPKSSVLLLPMEIIFRQISTLATWGCTVSSYRETNTSRTRKSVSIINFIAASVSTINKLSRRTNLSL